MLDQKNSRLYEEERHEIKNLKTAFLIGCYEKSKEKDLCQNHLLELESLAYTYGFEVLFKTCCLLKKIDAATYLGKGKIEELGDLAIEKKVDVIIFDEELSPKQQQNLEKIFKAPVIDRTELILEIFSLRAETKEAKLQIELAKSTYQLPRLKRLWTHLSRQVASGKGYLKGAGERQIEIDRRLVRSRITELKKELKEVAKQREVQRHQRRRFCIPTFAIIGYTNVGKSTLLQALTEADVLIEDKLFATLDTRARKFILPNQQEILLIDTVGFIRKIPHTLVASFKSTLEEAAYTDVLLHLIDVNHPLAEEHAQSTYRVLEELGIRNKPIITLLNKVDLVTDNSLLNRFKLKYPYVIPISAKKGLGFEALQQAMMEKIQSLRMLVKVRIPQKQYALVSRLMDEGKLIERTFQENDVLLEIEIPAYLKPLIKDFIMENK